jgi:threonine/homoserine/homoserine lactone efflux protein
LPEFFLAVFLLELTPGPNMGYLVALTLDRGRIAGLLATCGVAAGLTVHAAVAAAGLGALIAGAPVVYELLRWTGVTYILFLAWEGWKPDNENDRDLIAASSNALFWRGFFSNVFNPKSIMFFISVLPGFVRRHSADPNLFIQFAQLGTVYVVIATSVHASIVILAGKLSPWLTAGPHKNSLRRTLSFGLVIVAVWLAWTTRRV